jgi:hypothetical protein
MRRGMKQVSLLAAAVSVGALMALPTVGSAQTFVEFDAPNAGTTNYLGTIPTGINSSDAITGYTLDAYGVTRGFVRTSSGAIANFAVEHQFGWNRHGRLC